MCPSASFQQFEPHCIVAFVEINWSVSSSWCHVEYTYKGNAIETYGNFKTNLPLQVKHSNKENVHKIRLELFLNLRNRVPLKINSTQLSKKESGPGINLFLRTIHPRTRRCQFLTPVRTKRSF